MVATRSQGAQVKKSVVIQASSPPPNRLQPTQTVKLLPNERAIRAYRRQLAKDRVLSQYADKVLKLRRQIRQCSVVAKKAV